MVNEELSALCGTTATQRGEADRRLGELERKITNTRAAIEDGLADAAWANRRLRELQLEKQEAETARTAIIDLCISAGTQLWK